MNDSILSEILALAIKGNCEFALVGLESDPINASSLLICDGGASTTLFYLVRIVQIANQG
jgi:hypothetical protein